MSKSEEFNFKNSFSFIKILWNFLNLIPIIPELFQNFHDRMTKMSTDFGWRRPINFQLGAQSLPFPDHWPRINPSEKQLKIKINRNQIG